MSASGYGISFRDFVGLLNDKGWREETHPLIEQLLGCLIQQHGDSFILRAKNGTYIPYEVAHLQIQAHSASQGQLYQLAMSLWR